MKMKFIIVLFACSLTVILAWSGNDADGMREKECRKEMNLSEDKKKDPSNLGCLYACMHKKAGYLNVDGTLNIEIVTDGDSNPRFRESVQRVYQGCVEKAKGDACQLSFCLETTKL